MGAACKGVPYDFLNALPVREMSTVCNLVQCSKAAGPIQLKSAGRSIISSPGDRPCSLRPLTTLEVVARLSFNPVSNKGLSRDAVEPFRGGQFEASFKGIVGRIGKSPCLLLAPCILEGEELCAIPKGPIS